MVVVTVRQGILAGEETVNYTQSRIEISRLVVLVLVRDRVMMIMAGSGIGEIYQMGGASRMEGQSPALELEEFAIAVPSITSGARRYCRGT